MNQSQMAHQWYIQHELQKAESRFDLATAQVRRARDIAEAVRAAQVHVPSWLRSLTRRAELQMEHALERRVNEFLDHQFAALAAMTEAERKEEIGRLRSRQWNLLRGNLPAACHRIERELSKLPPPKA